jgi:2-dehydro-3-deoxyphosphogluconate aldolase / (4S)-4-hydroxy-2-oxoglutarate aldolase
MYAQKSSVYRCFRITFIDAGHLIHVWVGTKSVLSLHFVYALLWSQSGPGAMSCWSGRRKEAIMKETRIAAETQPTRSPERVSQATQFEYPIAATLTKHEVCACIEDTGVIPSVSAASPEDALFIADALTQAGIPIVEISMNAPYAMDLISYMVKHAPTMIVGGGSIRNEDTACECLDAGAKFLTTDGLVPGVVELAVKEKTATITGALTLTEVIAAWNSGTDFVKVVPCNAVGGHNYIRTLKAVIPQARLIAAGGVNQVTARNYIVAGATGLSVGNDLIPTDAIALRQTGRIQELARRFLTIVDNGRA